MERAAKLKHLSFLRREMGYQR